MVNVLSALFNTHLVRHMCRRTMPGHLWESTELPLSHGGPGDFQISQVELRPDKDLEARHAVALLEGVEAEDLDDGADDNSRDQALSLRAQAGDDEILAAATGPNSFSVSL
jgi:hypothetical protein